MPAIHPLAPSSARRTRGAEVPRSGASACSSSPAPWRWRRRPPPRPTSTPTSTRSATWCPTSRASRASPTPTSSTRGACRRGRRRRCGSPTTAPTSRRCTRGAIRRSVPVIVPLVVSIPGGAPTGTVFNPTSGFTVGGAPARFIFDSEAGQITAWNSGTEAQTVASTPGRQLQGPGDRHQGQGRLPVRRQLPQRRDRRLRPGLRAGRAPRERSSIPTCPRASLPSTSRSWRDASSCPTPSRARPATTSPGPATATWTSSTRAGT